MRSLASLPMAVLIAFPLAAQDAPVETVRSVVVVDGVLIEDAVVPVEESGVVVDPLTRSSAEAARKEAERILDRDALPGLFEEPAPDVTIVEVRSVAVTRPNRGDAEACIQVGVVKAKDDCRPKRK